MVRDKSFRFSTQTIPGKMGKYHADSRKGRTGAVRDGRGKERRKSRRRCGKGGNYITQLFVVLTAALLSQSAKICFVYS